MKLIKKSVQFITLLLLPILAYAHSEVEGTGFMSGFTHPLTGLDHALAMVSVGLVSAQIGGRYIWTVPTVFVLSMMISGAMGIFQIPLPFVEQGIAASVVLLGLAIVLMEKGRGHWVVLLMVAFFGLFHGHAHGTEMPNSASPIYYGVGFIFASSMMHVAGILIGHYATLTERSAQWLRYIGAVLAGMGLHIFITL